MTEGPLRIVLEFTRAEQPDDPFAFRFAPQEYLLRTEGGGVDVAKMPWSDALLADLASLDRPGVDPAVVQRVGEELRAFLDPTDWRLHEAAIVEAAKAGRPVYLTFRSAAAELYALPWELLTLHGSGVQLGALGEVLIRYAWPETTTAREDLDPPHEGGRVLVAWSAAGGEVPAAAHVAAIRDACAAANLSFDPDRDVLPHVSFARLASALEASSAGKPIAMLHIVCHGAVEGQTFGLAWDGDDDGASAVVIDAGRLRQLVAPHAGRLRAVVLCACASGNGGALGNHLGSVAQTLHRAGIQAVVGSRFPLSVTGSIQLAQTLYRTLLAEPSSLERAFLAARAELARDPERLDWASVQVYARETDGDDTRPIVFRPYRGLLTFQPAHRRFFFGRDDERAALRARVEAAASGKRPRLQFVAGASGSGKSSLVLAGLLPELVHEAQERVGCGSSGKARAERDGGAARHPDADATEGAARWELVQVRPAAEGGVRKTVQRVLLQLRQEQGALPPPTETSSTTEPTTPPTLPPTSLRKLSAEEWALCIVTTQTVQAEAKRFCAARQGRPLLFLVDQFEEIFTSGWTRAERSAFAQMLWTLSRTPDLPVVVLVTVRVDFLGRCGELLVDDGADQLGFDRLAYDPERTLFIPQIGSSVLREIVEKPALRVGLTFEPGLVDAILDDVGRHTAALPLLEYALDELWKRRRGAQLTQAAFHAMGSFMGALARTADQVLGKMRPGELAQARRLLVRMVSPAEMGGIETRRRVLTDRIRPPEPVEAKNFARALNRLVKSRLVLVGVDNPSGPDVSRWAELAHEALIPSWEQLRGWVAEDRAILHQIEGIRAASEDWKAHRDKPEEVDYALGGHRLALALELKSKHATEIDRDVCEFIDASQRLWDARRDRERRRALRAVAGAAVMALFTVLCLALLILRKPLGLCR